MKASELYSTLLDNNFGPFTGVPCSLVSGLISYVEHADDSDYYIAASEGEAMGIAGGLSLAGKTPVVMMQNDGYGNAVNPLSSLQLVYKLPALLLVTWRAEPGAKQDAIQHQIMGDTLIQLLEVFDIPYGILEDDQTASAAMIAKARAYTEVEQKPFALIIRKGIIDKDSGSSSEADPNFPIRIDYIHVLADEAEEDAVILGTTGYTGRELKQVIQRPGTFYTAGSMGCIGSIGLGIATQQPDRKVYVLDGDGALLMKMGTLSTIGHYHPKNLFHIVFDNGQYESTGGQSTVAPSTDFVGVAKSCNYAATGGVSTLEEFRSFINQHRDQSGPVLCHVKVQPGSLADLKRPAESPEELRDELWRFLGVGV